MIRVFARTANLLKLLAGYLVSVIVKKPVHWGKPVAASIEPVNHCNLSCPECPAGLKELTRPRGRMEPELFASILDQTQPHLSYLTLYFQGEPFLNSHFFEYISLARSRKIFVSTSTNGHFLDRENVRRLIDSDLNRLVISIDGADQSSYEAYRKGGDLSRVVEGTRLLVQEKKRLERPAPEIILQCLVLKTNEDRLDEIRRLGKELGVDRIQFKSAQFYDYENGNPLMPENPKYSRYERVDNSRRLHPGSLLSPGDPVAGKPRFRLNNRLRNSCFRMWSSCVFTWDGKVVPCCFDKDASHEMGDLATESFSGIWRGSRYDQFRKLILEKRRSIDICANCSQQF